MTKQFCLVFKQDEQLEPVPQIWLQTHCRLIHTNL